MRLTPLTSLQKVLLYLGIIVLALGIGAYRQRHANAPVVLSQGILLSEPKRLPEFALFDTSGANVTRADLEGAWTFLFFGYSHCPDICPITLAIMAQLASQLQPSEAQFVFVTLDPNRDRPAELEAYLQQFHPHIRGVTGAQDEIFHLTRSLNLYASNMDVPDRDLIDHSSVLLLINPQGYLSTLFTAPATTQEILRDFRTVRQGRLKSSLKKA